MAWLVIILISTIWRCQDHSILVSGSISFIIPPYTERKNHLNIAHCFCRQRESNPCCLRSKQVRYPLLHCLLASNVLVLELWTVGYSDTVCMLALQSQAPRTQSNLIIPLPDQKEKLDGWFCICTYSEPGLEFSNATWEPRRPGFEFSVI